MTEFAGAELPKAGEALSEARKLREADGSTPGAVDRAYFAAFHAARAVLSIRGTLPGDEYHLPAQFAEDASLPRRPPWKTPAPSGSSTTSRNRRSLSSGELSRPGLLNSLFRSPSFCILNRNNSAMYDTETMPIHGPHAHRGERSWA